MFKKYTKLAKKEEKKKGWLKKDHKNHAEINYAVNLYKEGGMIVNQICEMTLYRKLPEENK
ncbi:recombinase family protein [Bacillus haikouensis]|nr:recombinase family protein [Bacillus haikouensis]